MFLLIFLFMNFIQCPFSSLGTWVKMWSCLDFTECLNSSKKSLIIFSLFQNKEMLDCSISCHALDHPSCILHWSLYPEWSPSLLLCLAVAILNLFEQSYHNLRNVLILVYYSSLFQPSFLVMDVIHIHETKFRANNPRKI